MISEKFSLQEFQYSFPYHYIPHHFQNGAFSRIRALSWGLEYLCYMRFVAEKIIALEPKRILDVGCGDGRLINLLVESSVEAVGIDLSASALAFARAFNPNGIFVNADINEVEDGFDLVSAIEVIEHVPDEKMKGFASALALKVNRGGYLIVSAPTTNVPLNRKHYRHYDRLLMLEHLDPAKNGLQLLETNYVFNKDDLIYRTYLKFTTNHIWTFSVTAFEDLIWQRVWNRLKIANEKNAAHLVMVFRKTENE